VERMGMVIAAVIGVLSVPVYLLNFGGGIVGGIWLAISGNWKLILIGFLAMIVSSSFLMALALSPGLLCVGAAALATRGRRHIVASFFVLISNLYTSAVMTVWCVGCFYFVLQSFYGGGSLWPYLLWAYGMATGPWSYMAARDSKDAVGSSLSAFGACVGAIAMMGALLIESRPTLIDITIAFCVPLLVVLIAQFSLAIVTMREEAHAV